MATMNKCNKYDGHFDTPSFWAGMFAGILGILILIAILFGIAGQDYLIPVPEACQYAEDLCYPEYDGEHWSIVEGER